MAEKEHMIPSAAETQALPAIQLPLPANDREISAFAALEQRKTTREISATPLPLQLLSNLLWAACGVNRKTGPFGAPAGPPLRGATHKRSTSMLPSRKLFICTTHSTIGWQPSWQAICAPVL